MRIRDGILLAAFAIPACNQPETSAPSGASAASPPPATPAVASPTIAPTPTTASADPPFGNIAPSNKPPFEALQFRKRSEKADTGWPEFDAANFSNKPVVFLNVYGYAYDKDGKQVGRTRPLSSNEKLEPGKQTTIRVGRFQDKVSDTAVAFELCYTSIRFEGEKTGTRDDERCPEQKPKDES